LALLFAIPAVSQDVAKDQAQARCRFSGGTKIAVSYSHERHGYLFKTDGDLITIKGIRVPSGDYGVSTAKDEYGNWSLNMKNRFLKSVDPMLSALPMSAAWKDLTAENFRIAFEQTGGSCKMYWKQNDYLVLSLEFTRENADIPAFNRMMRQRY
jgi:hypothetical protein